MVQLLYDQPFFWWRGPFSEINNVITNALLLGLEYGHLSMRKLCSKWVPHLLTVDQKQQRVDDSERCLELFQRNKKDFLMRYVTMNETWIHHYTPESSR